MKTAPMVKEIWALNESKGKAAAYRAVNNRIRYCRENDDRRSLYIFAKVGALLALEANEFAKGIAYLEGVPRPADWTWHAWMDQLYFAMGNKRASRHHYEQGLALVKKTGRVELIDQYRSTELVRSLLRRRQ